MDESLSGIILMVLHFDLSCFKLKLKKMTHHFHGRLEKPWFVNHTPNWGLLVVVVLVVVRVCVCVCVCVEWWEVEGWSVIRRNIYTEIFIFNLWWSRERNSLLYTLWIKLKTSFRLYRDSWLRWFYSIKEWC
jgi:hypothetical protein